MLPPPTVAQLATFTGRDVSEFGPFATEALAQATLFFTIVSRCKVMPTDPDGQQLVRNGIMQLANQMFLEQPYQETRAAPFQSETIGSYSYSKSTPIALTVMSRPAELTGLFWWDLAIAEMACGDRLRVSFGSVSVMEDDEMYVNSATGQRTVLGPADINTPDVPFDVNSEMWPRPTH